MAEQQGGLLSFLNSAAGQGLLSAVGSGLLGARRGAPLNAIGAGLLGGVQGYAQAQDNQIQQQTAMQRNKLFDAQMQNYQSEAEARKQAMAQKQAQQNYLGSIGQVTSPRVGAQPNTFDPMRYIGLGGSVDEAKSLAGSQNWGKSAVKNYNEVRMPDGSVQIVGFDEFGNQVKTGAQPFKAPEVRDFGGYLGGVDPITGKVTRFGNKTMSPGEAAADARARERLEFDRSQPKGQFDSDRGLIIDPRTGAAKPVTLNGQPIGGKAHEVSEGERKAASLLTRLRGSQSQLQSALKTDPGAATPELAAETLRAFPFIGGDTPANLATSTGRQRVEAAQLDMLDAALTLGTGAAYTKEQLRGYAKSYFPQIGDDAATIADKQARLNNVIQAAEIAAGRANKQVPVPGGNSGWSIQEVK